MIEFQTEKVAMPAIDTQRVCRWVEAVAEGYGFRVGNIVYRFCDDDTIIATNREFLQHDYFTDIITFDYSRRGRISGDLLISLDTVRTNAEMVGTTYDDELLRVVIHGILHLCGINDKGPGEREIMEDCENKALALYKTI